ncbi:MAG: hypothetical protein AAGD07_15335 [Planctomycetota bacterium]
MSAAVTRRRDQSLRDQPSLFDEPAVVMGSPTTRRQVSERRGHAARDEQHAAKQSTTSRDREEVFARVVAAGTRGTTLDYIAAAMKRPPNALSGRVTELVAAGRVFRTAEKRTTRAGGSAGVLVAVGDQGERRKVEGDREEVCVDGSVSVHLGDLHRQSGRGSAPVQLGDESGERGDGMIAMKAPVDLPDADTGPESPRDASGCSLQPGSMYRVDGRRVMCFEDDCQLFVQACSAAGNAVMGSRPERVQELPAQVRIVRVDRGRCG